MNFEKYFTQFFFFHKKNILGIWDTSKSSGTTLWRWLHSGKWSKMALELWTFLAWSLESRPTWLPWSDNYARVWSYEHFLGQDALKLECLGDGVSLPGCNETDSWVRLWTSRTTQEDLGLQPPCKVETFEIHPNDWSLYISWS